MPDKVNKRQSVKTTIETRDFENIKSKGPDLEFCPIEVSPPTYEGHCLNEKGVNKIKNLSPDEFREFVAAHQYTLCSLSPDLEIDESVYQLEEASPSGQESDSDSEQIDLEKKSEEQKARLKEVLKANDLEDYGKLIPKGRGLDKKKGNKSREGEKVNELQAQIPDNEITDLLIKGVRRVPDSLKVGALVAAGLGLLNRSLLGSLCIMGASAYVWDHWPDIMRLHKEVEQPKMVNSGEIVRDGEIGRIKHNSTLDGQVQMFNKKGDPDFLIGKLLNSTPLSRNCDVYQAEDCGSESSLTSKTSTSNEAAVYECVANTRIPSPPPSLVPSESDLEVQVAEGRVFFPVRFNSNLRDHKCLFDPGATSSVISRRSLRIEEQLCNRKFPRLPREAKVKAFGDSDPKLKMEIVLLDIYVDGKLRSRYAPLLIEEGFNEKYEALIGINLLSKWGVSWEMDNGITELYFKRNCITGLNIKELDPKRTLPAYVTETNLRVVKGVTVESLQTIRVLVKPEQNFHEEHGDLVEVVPEVCDLDMSSTPSVVELNKRANQFAITMTNDSDLPIYLTEDLEIGKVRVYGKCLQEEVFEQKAEPKFVEPTYEYATTEVSCSCNFRVDREVNLIIFNNEFGESAHRRQVINGMHPLEKWRQAPRVICDDEHVIQILRNLDGSFTFDHRTLGPKLKKKARVLLSFREELDKEMKVYLEKLRRLVPDIEICQVRNKKCKVCGSLANRDDEELFSNINGVKIYAIEHKQQPYSLWRVADEDSPVAYFHVGDYVHAQVFKSNFKLFIYLHMTKWHNQQKYRWETTMHLLMTQLKILQIPPTLSILTTFDDMASVEVKQMMRALFLTKPWEGSPKYVPKTDKIARIKIVDFMMEHCSCEACAAIQNFKPCPVDYYKMLYQGNLGDPKGVAKNTRAHVEDIEPTVSEIGEIWAHILNATAEIKSLPDFGENRQKILPGGGKDDKEDNESENSFIDDQNFVGTVPDGDEILHSYHKVVDWRTIITEESLPEIPGKPEIKQMLVGILDRRTDVFAANEYEWRWLNVPPVFLHWVNENVSVVDRPTSFNPNRGSQLVDKVLRLLELAMVKIVPRSDGSWLQNVCNSYVVPHSSQTKRDMLTGKVGTTELTEKSELSSTMRLILDLRSANKHLKNAHQNDNVLDCVDMVLSRIAEAKSLSKLDLTKAYRGLPVAEESMKALCFRANYGMLKPFLFSFTSLPDGLSICPAVYQTKIEEALMTELDHAIVYIDDIIIFHDSPENNLKVLDNVLGKLQEVNALVSLKKCEFLFKTGEFLGFGLKVTESGVMYGIPQSKLEVFQNMQCPTSRKFLLTYYGMLNFLYKNIPGLQAHVEPLTRFLPTKIPRPFVMTEVQKQAFEKLNKTLDKLPMLHLFSFERTAYLMCDASLTHAGACLAQLNDDGSIRPCSFYSKKFDDPTIYNSTSIDKEITAVMMAVRHYQKYLVHCVKTVIITDLAAMVSMLSSQVEFQNTKVGRQSFKLFSFNFSFQLRHVSSKWGVLPDMLSRLFDQPVTQTGLPVAHKADLDEFFEKYKSSIPQSWKDGAIFTYQDMINHLTETVMQDPTITNSLKSKRLNGLLDQLQPQYMPESIKFAKRQIESSVYKSRKVEDPKTPEIKAYLVEYRQDSLLIPQFYDVQAEERAPPRRIQTLSIERLVRLQHSDPQCKRAIMHILTTPEEKQDGRIRNHFKVINGNLLICRKTRKRPWSDEGNLRVYLTPVPALTVLTTLHLIYGHAGKNQLEFYFSASFKCKNRRELAYSLIEGCGPCVLYKWNVQKQALPGRFVIPEKPHIRYHADIVEFPPGIINKSTYKYYLGVIDAYSSFLMLYHVKSQTTKDILHAFEHLFCMCPPPNTLCLDNATYFRSEDFQKGVKNLGVKQVQFSTPNKSTTNSPIENRFSTLRKLVQMNMDSFGFKSHSQVIYASVTQMNVRPLYRLRNFTDDPLPPSSTDLFYKLDPMERRCPVAKYMQDLEPKDQKRLQEKQEKMLREYDKQKAEAHEVSIRDIRLAEEKLRVGSLVLATNWKKKKHLEKGTHSYKKVIFVVVGIAGQRVTIKPMFSSTKHTFVTNVNDVKPLKSYRILNMLPKELQKFIGHVDYSSDMFKNARHPPAFHDDRTPVFVTPKLRSHKTVKASIAEPAIDTDANWDEDEGEEEDEDMDWDWFFEQEVDPNLRIIEPPLESPKKSLKQRPSGARSKPVGPISPREDLAEMPDMPQEMEPNMQLGEGESPMSKFTKNLRSRVVTLGNKTKRFNSPFAQKMARKQKQQAFGAGPAFPSPLIHTTNKQVHFGDSTIRTYKNPDWKSFGRALLTGNYKRFKDKEVPTNFGEPVSRFDNMPSVTSSPMNDAESGSPGLRDSPIPQRHSVIQPGYRHNNSSIYEEANSTFNSTAPFYTPEANKSVRAPASDGLSFDFGQLNLGNDTAESTTFSPKILKRPESQFENSQNEDPANESWSLPNPSFVQDVPRNARNNGSYLTNTSLNRTSGGNEESLMLPDTFTPESTSGTFDTSVGETRDPLQISDSFMPNTSRQLNMPISHNDMEPVSPELEWDYDDINFDSRPSHESKANTSRARQKHLENEEALDSELNLDQTRLRPSRQSSRPRRQPDRFQFEKLGGTNKKPRDSSRRKN